MHDDKLKDECGVVGIHSKNRKEISRLLYYGLISLQHRGQESAGIAVKDNKEIKYYKEMGLVKEVFSEEILDSLEGEIGIGHVRYSTTGESFVSNAQPLVVHYKGGKIALAHNGNLINAIKIRDELEDKGSIFQTSIDSEVIANLIARNYKFGIKESLIKSFELLKGSFALVIIYNDKLIGARDPNGIRPLSIGKLDGDYILSSETCNFDILGADFVRDVEPGEIVIIDDNGIESVKYADEKKALCSFEYVYFARPDSNIDGVNVYKARVNAGRILAKESFVEADIVAAVPDSGTPAAIGFSQASGIPYDIALIKNKYMGRTFINPDQKSRELGVRLKLNVAKENIKGKRVVLVDDSIVRGTTSKRIIRMLRKAGAKEVHFRISSPPVKHSCYFGIDTPSKKHLVGAMMTTDEICKEIGADSLAYISIEGLVESIGMGKENLCAACFDGEYPMEVPKMSHKFVFEKR
jgi:amidophosphoribosyltransferase